MPFAKTHCVNPLMHGQAELTYSWLAYMQYRPLPKRLIMTMIMMMMMIKKHFAFCSWELNPFEALVRFEPAMVKSN